MNNTLYLRQDATKGSAFFAACIPNRSVTFKVTVEATLLATKNWHAMHAAATEVPISLAIGRRPGTSARSRSPGLSCRRRRRKADAEGT